MVLGAGCWVPVRRAGAWCCVPVPSAGAPHSGDEAPDINAAPARRTRHLHPALDPRTSHPAPRTTRKVRGARRVGKRCERSPIAETHPASTPHRHDALGTCTQHWTHAPRTRHHAPSRKSAVLDVSGNDANAPPQRRRTRPRRRTGTTHSAPAPSTGTTHPAPGTTHQQEIRAGGPATGWPRHVRPRSRPRGPDAAGPARPAGPPR